MSNSPPDEQNADAQADAGTRSAGFANEGGEVGSLKAIQLYRWQFLDNPEKERAGHVEANSFYYNVLNMICSDETAHSHHWAKTHALPFLPEDWKKPSYIRISARVRPLYLRYLKYRG